MLLAAYSLAMSLIYLIVYVVAPATAGALVILFVALLLVPSCVAEVRRSRDR